MPNEAVHDDLRVAANVNSHVKKVIGIISGKGGDGKSLSVAAASILAKVTRDRIMAELAQKYPYYGWEKNAGYGTKAHQAGLAKYGITPEHRRSYAPIKKLLGN